MRQCSSLFLSQLPPGGEDGRQTSCSSCLVFDSVFIVIILHFQLAFVLGSD